MRSSASGAGCLDASFAVSAMRARECRLDSALSIICAFYERAAPDAPETIDDQRRCTGCRYRTIYGGSRGSASLRAPESAHQPWGGSPHRTEHWLSVVEGNCVVERRGGRQPEMNCQSINKAMLNTIRPDALASLRRVSEAQNRTPTRKGQGNFGDLSSGETVSAGEGMHGVGGDRMAGSWSDMNQGSLFGKGTAFMTDERTEEPCPKGDRAFVRAKKRGNARGAKGGRKVEA